MRLESLTFTRYVIAVVGRDWLKRARAPKLDDSGPANRRRCNGSASRTETHLSMALEKQVINQHSLTSIGVSRNRLNTGIHAIIKRQSHSAHDLLFIYCD